MSHYQAGANRLMVTDILRDDLREVMAGVQVGLVYVDPPWNRGNLATWYHKASLQDTPEFLDLTRRLIRLCGKYSPRAAYLEMGRQFIDTLEHQARFEGAYVTNSWEVVYYRKRPSNLIRISFNSPDPLPFDLTGWDDMLTVQKAIELDCPGGAVVDFCSGKGRTAKCAFWQGLQFVGTELNPKRADLLLNWWRTQGLEVERV
jgi:hypothetical protein